MTAARHVSSSFCGNTPLIRNKVKGFAPNKILIPHKYLKNVALNGALSLKWNLLLVM